MKFTQRNSAGVRVPLYPAENGISVSELHRKMDAANAEAKRVAWRKSSPWLLAALILLLVAVCRLMR